MARMTAHQKDVGEKLIAEYGGPDRIALEQNDEPYGLMYMVWFKQVRILFVKPDGTRQLFEGLQVPPSNLIS